MSFKARRANRKKMKPINDMVLTAGWVLKMLSLELEALVSETADEVMPEVVRVSSGKLR
jgi:hypothetical protein